MPIPPQRAPRAGEPIRAPWLGEIWRRIKRQAIRPVAPLYSKEGDGGTALGIKLPITKWAKVVTADIPAASSDKLESGTVELYDLDDTVSPLNRVNSTTQTTVYNGTNSVARVGDYVIVADVNGVMTILLNAGSSGGGSGSGLERCQCPDPPYEIQVNCGSCGIPFGDDTWMPKYYNFDPVLAEVNTGAFDCSLGCNEFAGHPVLLEKTTGCVWEGRSVCFAVELALVSGDTWKVTITDNAGCVVAILTTDNFACCGTTTEWTNDASNDCNFTISVSAHECTCCPVPTCPPDGKPLCSASSCCVEHCTIEATVTGYAGDPGGPGETQCGIFPDIYTLTWVKDCTWRCMSTNSGTTCDNVSAELTLSGVDWTLTLTDPNTGAVAVLRSNLCVEPWECTQNQVNLCPDDAATTCLPQTPRGATLVLL